MFEKTLPFLMYALMVATLVLSAIGLLSLLNLMLAFFGVETIEISMLTVGGLALLIGVGVKLST